MFKSIVSYLRDPNANRQYHLLPFYHFLLDSFVLGLLVSLFPVSIFIIIYFFSDMGWNILMENVIFFSIPITLGIMYHCYKVWRLAPKRMEKYINRLFLPLSDTGNIKQEEPGIFLFTYKGQEIYVSFFKQQEKRKQKKKIRFGFSYLYETDAEIDELKDRIKTYVKSKTIGNYIMMNQYMIIAEIDFTLQENSGNIAQMIDELLYIAQRFELIPIGMREQRSWMMGITS